MQSQPKNIVLFGETGSGKSSLVNMLLGAPRAEISDAAIGCTFRSTPYIDRKLNYVYHDTVGLSEGTKGRVEPMQAIADLFRLLRTMEGGVHLLIFVMKKGKITEPTQLNYDLFVKTITDNKVPVLLVITHCENIKDMASWWRDNKVNFDKYGMKFNEVIWGCTAPRAEGIVDVLGDRMEESYKKTRETVVSSIGANVMLNPWVMGEWINWARVIGARVYNIMAKFVGLRVIPMNKALYKLYRGMDQNRMVASMNANRLFKWVTKGEKAGAAKYKYLLVELRDYFKGFVANVGPNLIYEFFANIVEQYVG